MSKFRPITSTKLFSRIALLTPLLASCGNTFSSSSENTKTSTTELSSVSSLSSPHPNDLASLLPYEAKKDTLKRRIFGYYPPADKAGFIAAKEAGITDLIATPWACGYLEERGEHYASMAQEAGLNVFPYIGSKEALSQTDLFSPSWLKNQSNVPGVYLCDEPFPDEMDQLAAQVDSFNQTLPNKAFLSCLLDPGGMAFTSRWPSSVSYDDYVNSYCEKVLDRLTGPKWLMGDTYPLSTLEGKPVISSHHLSTLTSWGAAAKMHGAEANVCLMADDAMIFENPTIGSLRFQANACQAFGIQHYTIYTVDTPPSGVEEYRKAMWQNGGKTSIYPLVKQLNDENQAYAYLPLQFRYDATTSLWPLALKQDDVGYRYEKAAIAALNALDKPEAHLDLTNSKVLKTWESDVPSLLARYVDANQNEAFFAMNYSSPHHTGNGFLTFSFERANHAIVLRSGQYYDFALSSSELSLSLLAGEGAFILPYFA